MIPRAIILVPDSHGSLLLFGIAAVQRLVQLLLQLDVADVHLVGRTRSMQQALGRLANRVTIHQADDLSAVTKVIERLNPSPEVQILVMRADHVVDRRSVKIFLDQAVDRNTNYCLAGKTGDKGQGIFLVRDMDLLPVVRYSWNPRGESRSLDVEVKIIKSPVELPCILEGPEDILSAEEKLIDALGLQTEDSDGFFARHFDRRISRFISKRLASTGISPNQITLIGVSIGLSGAWLLSRGGYWAPLLGAFSFLFCVIVDGVDGEVARLTLRESTFGHYLDIVTDNIVHVAVFVGIAYGLYHETGNSLYLRALWFMLGGFVLCLIAVYQCILRKSAEQLERSPKLMRIMALMTNRDFAYLVAFLAMIHRLQWFFIGCVFGTYLFAATLWFLHYWESSGRRMPCRVKSR